MLNWPCCYWHMYNSYTVLTGMTEWGVIQGDVLILVNPWHAEFFLGKYKNIFAIFVISSQHWYGIGTWWRHQMETFSVLLDLCAGNSPVTGEFPSQRPVMWSFDVFFVICAWINGTLSKQSWGLWFETPSHSLWHHCNELKILLKHLQFYMVNTIADDDLVL